MEGVEATVHTAHLHPPAGPCCQGKKRKRIGDDAFAEAKAAVFDAKMKKRAADTAARCGDASAGAAAAADDVVGKCVEKAALIAALIANKAVEKAAKAASAVIADYLEHYDDADFKQTKQTLANSRRSTKSLAEAQAAAGTAMDHAGKVDGSITMSLPFYELPVFHVRRAD